MFLRSIPKFYRKSNITFTCTVLVTKRNISSIGVIGAGQMGIGITQVAAQEGKLKVILVDSKSEQITKYMGNMKKILSRNVEKGQMTQQEVDSIFSKISTSTSLKDLSLVDFVVEAVTENLEVKNKIFKELSTITPKTTILASNTSSISITKMGSFTDRPDRVIGMHFMNPVPIMKLVEIIPGLRTSNETLKTTLELAKSFGKITAQSSDSPGFIANRILMPYINEAITALHEGVATVEDIDKCMKLGTNVPMGPLTLADFIGLDTCLSIMRVLHTEIGDSKYRPNPLLIKYVDAGYLGKKTGRGFYNYETKS